MRSFQTISPPPRTNSISSSSPSAVLYPLRCSIDFNPRCLYRGIFPLASYIRRLFRGSGSFTFPLDSMRKPPARVLYGLFGAKPSWIALAQNSLRSLGKGRKGGRVARGGRGGRGGGKERRCTFRIRCIRLSVAENNARCLTNVCEPWRLASRIMLSTTYVYALRSATSGKSRREFYCSATPVMRDKLGSS